MLKKKIEAGLLLTNAISFIEERGLSYFVYNFNANDEPEWIATLAIKNDYVSSSGRYFFLEVEWFKKYPSHHSNPPHLPIKEVRKILEEKFIVDSTNEHGFFVRLRIMGQKK